MRVSPRYQLQQGEILNTFKASWVIQVNRHPERLHPFGKKRKPGSGLPVGRDGFCGLWRQKRKRGQP